MEMVPLTLSYTSKTHGTQTTLHPGILFYKLPAFIGIVEVRGLVILDLKLIKIKHQRSSLKEMLSSRFAVCQGHWSTRPVRIDLEELFFFLYILA